MALTELGSAVRGGAAFLTRLPVTTSEGDWLQFQGTPAVFPLVGYLIGVLVALPFVLLGGHAAAAGFLLALFVVAGINHMDGVADLGDAAAIHDAEDRKQALKDTTTGVGGTVAVAVIVAGLALAGLALASMPFRAAVALVVASEVGAKLGMATVACLGTASHEGLGSQFTRNASRQLLLGPALVAVPAAMLTGFSPAALVAVLAGPAVAVGLVRWADDALGGVNGDVFGATNELGRVVALHAGVYVWMYF
ncbi:adenosylcobinamide-GDP ribazoletransferase [Natronomonas halophila]|uniref:adenosylcobinamide-GDP ribazoletransferase n=1 Tax=Natronomonas halophila TaxID=2747817 RepID=UPI0015B6228A|nr:adenosylcobinamide-GDP ribazoletransferase [Natronomonas halophila]QLD86048.1 adenosylcobinamide-GDP ribazoletransferase [Natronomonas halophila]